MGLIWQCARCGSQREGHTPPDIWLRLYVPVRGSGGARSRRSDVICDACEDSLHEWFVDGKGGSDE